MYNIKLTELKPKIGMPGGKFQVVGEGFSPWDIADGKLHFAEDECWIDAISETSIFTKVPEKKVGGKVYLRINDFESNKLDFYIPKTLSTGLHMVDNPVIDSKGNIYATFSGNRGETTPVSVYQISLNGKKHIHIRGIPNATSLAVNKDNHLFIASRYNGKIYISKNTGEYEIYCQGLGVAFGLAFNSKGELFAGDRNGTIFRVETTNQAMFYCSIPQSYIAFHMGFDYEDNLYVSNPVHMGENYIYKVLKNGEKQVFYKGLSLFHGFTFDKNNNMYVAESKREEDRIVKITQNGEYEIIISGNNFIGVAFDAKGNLIAATNSTLYLIPKEKLD